MFEYGELAMNVIKSTNSISSRALLAHKRSILVPLIALLLLSASGLPVWTPSPTVAAEFVPQFEWSMLPRHTGTSLIDPNNLDAARAYVQPGTYGVQFDGCNALLGTESAVTHTYTITGDLLPEPLVVSKTEFPKRNPHEPGFSLEPVACEDMWVRVWLALGSYSVTLHIREGETEATSVPVTMTLRDILIISVGDSYGSGEGAPDKEVQYDGFLGFPSKAAEWQDERCHRSAWAGPSKAAAILEYSDPHTSVTFVSLACSGSTINTPITDSERGELGAGLLSGYAGIWPKTVNPAVGTFLPPQMHQAARIANGRAIDALTISGGGNDMHFATVISDCVTSDCRTNQTTIDRLEADFALLPLRYQELADFIEHDWDELEVPADIPALNITPDRVFITEYPNPTRDANGDWCSALTIDDPLLGFVLTGGISKEEMRWAHHEVVTPLNLAIKRAAEQHGWNYVTGIAAEFYGAPEAGRPGHGWCVLGNDEYGRPNNWINRSTQSLAIQGPVTIPMGWIVTVGVAGITLAWVTAGASLLATLWGGVDMILELKGTDGTMHPNRMGQMVIARHLAAAIQTTLSGTIPVPDDTTPPTIQQPSDIVVLTADPEGATVNYSPPQTLDNTDPAGQAICTPPPGSLFVIGTTLVTCTAQDSAGNQAIPVHFNITVQSMPSPPDGSTSLSSYCRATPTDNQYLNNYLGPVEFDGVNASGAANGGSLKASVQSSQDECYVEVINDAGFTVGAGTTGLVDGDPVLVSVAVALDGTLETSPEMNRSALTEFSSYFTISPSGCDLSNFDFNANNIGCSTNMHFTSIGVLSSYQGDESSEWYTDLRWYARSNAEANKTDTANYSCEVQCETVLTIPFASGVHTVTFQTKVGDHLAINSGLRVFARDGATSDFANTFEVSSVFPAPGFEGLSLIYDGSEPNEPEDNQPPVIDAVGPFTVDEGGSTELAALATDPEGEDLSYAWDLDGDGVFESDGQTVTFSAANLDGPVTLPVRVQVTDASGKSSVAETTIAVSNVVPSINALTDAALHPGETFVGSGSFVDPGADSFTATVDYGDGSQIENLELQADNSFVLEHFYADPGAFTVTVCVDDGQGSNCGVFVVTVIQFALYTGQNACGDGLSLSGSSGTVKGDVHANGGLKLSGSNNRVDGTVTYRCKQRVTGSKNSFAVGPTELAADHLWPVSLAPEDFTCDLTVAGKLDLGKDGQWWLNGSSKSRQLVPMTLCADEISLSGSSISGTVTLIANSIKLSGSRLSLNADQHGVLLFALGDGSGVVKVSGSSNDLTGDLIAPAGEVDISGSSLKIAGSVIGWTVKIAGSSWKIGQY